MREGCGVNKAELQRILIQEGVRPDSYDLEGGLLPERLTLECIRERLWCVYYSERGQQSNRREFGSEGEACHYFLGLVRASDEFMRP